jgi:histidyl-tRNA synthetase
MSPDPAQAANSTGAIAPVKGMPDVLPDRAAAWQLIERTAREIFASYGYEEIRVPLVEQTALFKRAIGEFTDVVEKEMFTFQRDETSLALRPEATAGIVRAAISNGLLHNQRHRLYTFGPMFRGEQPQLGRYRQFHQIDAEAFGYEGPDVDAELILISARLWRRLGIESVSLELNSLGTPESRREHRAALVAYFSRHESALDGDSRRRLAGNPLRILDSKNPALAELIAGAPLLPDFLDPASREHFEGLKARLADAGVAFRLNPRLVRGLDYYTRTVFEWVTGALGGAQNAVCSGGRYDGLVTQLGGEPTPGIGWALGFERLVLLLEAAGRLPPRALPHLYLVLVGATAERRGLVLAERLRDALPWLRIETGLGGGSFKAQFRRADKSGAPLALVLGDSEVERGVAALKPLRAGGEQLELKESELAARIVEWPGLAPG